MKGVSPIVASVVLIAITMAIAAVLANYVSTLTQQTFSNLPTCVGGYITFASADYPKWNEADSSIVAVVEAQGVDLGKFKFTVTLNNDTVLTYNDVTGHVIPAGAVGDIRTGTLPFAKSDIKRVRVVTNCSNVRVEDVIK